MPIDLIASREHYLSHAVGIWLRLPDDLRGDIYCDPAWHEGARPLREIRSGTSNPCLVSGAADLRWCKGPAIMAEHGIGQSYSAGKGQAGRHSAYPGGDGRGKVALFCSPNEHAANRDRRRYPRATVEVVGVTSLSDLSQIPTPEPSERPVVAISSRWQCSVSRESNSTWGHWRDAFATLCASGQYEVLGHGHPRIFGQLEPSWKRMGAEPVRDFREVVARAEVYIADNSASMFEAAALGIPVVVLDHPAYRVDVHHGLRFWEAADIGPRILDPLALPGAVRAALAKRPWPGGEKCLRIAVPDIDDPAQRAADVVTAWAAARV